MKKKGAQTARPHFPCTELFSQPTAGSSSRGWHGCARPGPAELDIPDIGLRPTLACRWTVEPIAKRIEELAEQARSRILPNGHIITIPGCPDVAVRRDIGDEVAPESYQVILVITTTPALQGKAH